jgi:penicillin-binding protein-related factor A (putative recombinase)
LPSFPGLEAGARDNYLKEVYLLKQQLLTRLLRKKEKAKRSIKIDFLQEYRLTVIAKDNIKYYFNSLQVNFVLNKKECQVQ